MLHQPTGSLARSSSVAWHRKTCASGTEASPWTFARAMLSSSAKDSSRRTSPFVPPALAGRSHASFQ